MWLIAPSLGLPMALLVGAIVATSDAVSAAAIEARLGLPRRVMNVISGESLVNDATSITLFRTFAAIVAVIVTWLDGVGSFLIAVAVGTGLGLLIGWLVNLVRTRLDDPRCSAPSACSCRSPRTRSRSGWAARGCWRSWPRAS